jgi:hypothetical protein
LGVFARWLWAELDVLPEDSIGKAAVARLSSEALKSVRAAKWNDLYYTQLVLIWLPYVERLFQDASECSASGSRNQCLRSLGYDAGAVDIFLTKSWRSPIEFTCECLAARGGIQMVKPRQDPDMARTLRNAYTRVLGQGTRHQLLRKSRGQ